MGLSRVIKARGVNHGAVTVGTSAVVIAAADDRESILIQNLGAADIYVGGSSVTTANGVKVTASGGTLTLYTCAAVYAISGSAGNDVRYLEETY